MHGPEVDDSLSGDGFLTTKAYRVAKSMPTVPNARSLRISGDDHGDRQVLPTKGAGKGATKLTTSRLVVRSGRPA
jgi:hypothetical protein